ncbi:hypothetical protein HPB52_014340 [Rhipicephalus sanguineus]|uniref:Endonuclease/exonuclease/phosphatase domain-containing protein n=1 Tax=Rhipicephalus sanguineus TaxID=34632 RepID=A0A9D4Q0E7_RHISA|nr:hypothetical protein HPB52_014340 [Rhipicephalus sanguineus]
MAPDVILRQEPNCTPSLAGFEAYGSDSEFSKLGDKLLICGDFNAAHSVWGYPKNTGKGTKLWDNICNMRFTLLSDPAQPTRVGNSVSRDTCPDLTIIRDTGAVISSGPLDETLDSPDRLLQELQARYIPSGASPQYNPYPYVTDMPNALDAEITIQEALIAPVSYTCRAEARLL